jgi:hypothetical protein
MTNFTYCSPSYLFYGGDIFFCPRPFLLKLAYVRKFKAVLWIRIGSDAVPDPTFGSARIRRNSILWPKIIKFYRWKNVGVKIFK